ncbi:hypothetical protein ACFQX6_56325 [Streptosporangium lutulentum]
MDVGGFVAFQVHPGEGEVGDRMRSQRPVRSRSRGAEKAARFLRTGRIALDGPDRFLGPRQIAPDRVGQRRARRRETRQGREITGFEFPHRSAQGRTGRDELGVPGMSEPQRQQQATGRSALGGRGRRYAAGPAERLTGGGEVLRGAVAAHPDPEEVQRGDELAGVRLHGPGGSLRRLEVRPGRVGISGDQPDPGVGEGHHRRGGGELGRKPREDRGELAVPGPEEDAHVVLGQDLGGVSPVRPGDRGPQGVQRPAVRSMRRAASRRRWGTSSGDSRPSSAWRNSRKSGWKPYPGGSASIVSRKQFSRLSRSRIRAASAVPVSAPSQLGVERRGDAGTQKETADLGILAADHLVTEVIADDAAVSRETAHQPLHLAPTEAAPVHGLRVRALRVRALRVRALRVRALRVRALRVHVPGVHAAPVRVAPVRVARISTVPVLQPQAGQAQAGAPSAGASHQLRHLFRVDRQARRPEILSGLGLGPREIFGSHLHQIAGDSQPGELEGGRRRPDSRRRSCGGACRSRRSRPCRISGRSSS